MATMEEQRLLSLCGGCAPLAAESRYLGVQFASVGPWKVRVVAIDCQGPIPLLGELPEKATPIEAIPVSANIGEKGKFRVNDKGVTAFFVHGGGGRAGQFRHQIHYLAQRGVRCIAADLPGHGVSLLATDRAGGKRISSLEESQAILKATFDTLAATRPEQAGIEWCPRRRAVLIAHSFGCLQALRLYEQLLAENRAEEIAAICLIGGNTAQRLPNFASWLMLKLPHLFLQFIRSIIGRVAQRLLYCSETREHNRRVLEQEHEITSRNPFDSMLEILGSLRNGTAHKKFTSAADAFRRSPRRPPVLLMYGELDAVSVASCSAAGISAALGGGPLPSPLPSPQYLNLPSTATTASTSNEDGSWGTPYSSRDWVSPGKVTATLIGKAGHNVMLEQPVETNKLLWEFVKPHLKL